MHLYPFDTETCTLDITIEGNDYHYTNLDPSGLKYTGTKDIASGYIMLDDYKVKKKLFHKSGRRGVQVEIKFGRKIISIFFSTYLPTLLMNIINQATSHFEGTQFEGDIIQVNFIIVIVNYSNMIAVINIIIIMIIIMIVNH